MPTQMHINLKHPLMTIEPNHTTYYMATHFLILSQYFLTFNINIIILIQN